jgi:hypothetical protein
MEIDLSKQFIEQLDKILEEALKIARGCHDAELRRASDKDKQKIITLSIAAIERAAGSGSTYAKQAKFIMDKYQGAFHQVEPIVGVIDALRQDIAAGHVESLTELLHGELFGDFLEMAQHLLDKAYKDAAAVIAGSSLEAHLKQLCQKNDIDTEITISSRIEPKKADLINSELTKSEAYTKLDQKNITAWLDLRNKAAHGKYEEYTKE